MGPLLDLSHISYESKHNPGSQCVLAGFIYTQWTTENLPILKPRTMLLETATAVLLVCAFLSSSAFAEVQHGEFKIELEIFDLETQYVDINRSHRNEFPGGHPKMDFHFSKYAGLPSLYHNEFLEGFRRRIAIFDGQPFNAIAYADIKTATFSYDPVDFPLEANDTVILQTDSGAYYKIGNVVYSDNTDLVNFNYEELTDESAIGRVFQDGFENPVNLNCGNGVIEREKLEACDDGNNIDGDGCSSDCNHDKLTGRCPCADSQKWNDVLANENFICGSAEIWGEAHHWFVYLNTASGIDQLIVGNGPHVGASGPYCSGSFSDGSLLDLGISVMELAVCENQIITKAAENGAVCNDDFPF